ncbi:hypothetical protein V6Z11_A04G048700 [Gossypium hirsutum]
MPMGFLVESPDSVFSEAGEGSEHDAKRSL